MALLLLSQWKKVNVFSVLKREGFYVMKKLNDEHVTLKEIFPQRSIKYYLMRDPDSSFNDCKSNMFDDVFY